MWQFALAALAAMSVGTVAAAAPCSDPFEGDVSLALVRRIVAERDAASVDELLSCLPRDYRKNFTLVYRSRSPEHDSVDPLHPRVLLFGTDARLLMAFTGDASKELYDRLQLIEFRETEQRFFFAEVAFVPGDGAVPRAEIQESPAACASCHGADGHPIWDSYDLWPGVYGSVNDGLPLGSVERRNYLAFLAHVRGQGRYAQLVWGGRTPTPPYHDPESMDPALFPNLRLNKLLARLNAKRVFRTVKESPRYEGEKLRLARGLLGCESLGVSRTLRDRMKASLEEAQAAKARANQPFAKAGSFRADYYADASARVLRVAQILGLEAGEWPLTLDRATNDFEDGDAALDDFLLSEIFVDLAVSHPELNAWTRIVDEGRERQRNVDPDGTLGAKARYGAYDAVYSKLGGALDRSRARPSCERLRAWDPNPDLTKVEEEPEPLAYLAGGRVSLTASGNLLQQHCGRCHAGTAPTSKRIPVDDPDRMRRALQGNKKLGPDILRRIASTGKDRMPPKEALSEFEMAALSEYVRSLAE